jgi:GNAT superfamily N-acetyltransferase
VDGSIKGYFSYTYDISTWDASPYLHLDCLFLQEDMRGKRIGGEILKFLKDEAKQNNCINLQWQTPVFNHSAIEFYKKNGAYSKTKERFFLKLN